MTPLEYAEELRKLAEQELLAIPTSLPTRTWSQLGEVVLECEALAASVTSLNSQELGGPTCEYAQVGTVTIAIARECSNTSYDDGSTNIPALNVVSAQQDKDAEALWNLALSLDVYVIKDFVVTWLVLGALSITTLTMTIGVP